MSFVLQSHPYLTAAPYDRERRRKTFLLAKTAFPDLKVPSKLESNRIFHTFRPRFGHSQTISW